METITRKRIEILADTPLLRLVTEAIDRSGISGWSIIPLSAGKGHDGEWQEEMVTGADKALVVAIAPDHKAEKLVGEIAPLLTSHGMLLSMWDVQVIREERF